MTSRWSCEQSYCQEGGVKKKEEKKTTTFHRRFICIITVQPASAHREASVASSPCLPALTPYQALLEASTLILIDVTSTSLLLPVYSDAPPGCWCEWQRGEALLIQRWQIIIIIWPLGACTCARVCACVCGAMACMYCLSFFQLLELWLNVHFQQSAPSKNYWAPLGFTHSLTLISFLRSDEKWGRSWAGLAKEVRVESGAAHSQQWRLLRSFPASIRQQEEDSGDLFFFFFFSLRKGKSDTRP